MKELGDLFLDLGVHYKAVESFIELLLVGVLALNEGKDLGLDASLCVVANHLNRNPAALRFRRSRHRNDCFHFGLDVVNQLPAWASHDFQSFLLLLAGRLAALLVHLLVHVGVHTHLGSLALSSLNRFQNCLNAF